MLKQREILGLLNQGMSQKNNCASVHCSKRDVSEVSKAARDTGKSYGELLALCDSELLTVLNPQASAPVEDPRKMELETMMPDIIRRLKSKHATMQFVHETFYKKLCPDGYGYTQFKLHLQKYRESHDYSYHNDYEPGEQMQIDFAGDVLYLSDRMTGESQKLVILVTVMPYSNLPFMMAMPTPLKIFPSDFHVKVSWSVVALLACSIVVTYSIPRAFLRMRFVCDMHR